jgi:hypothetical protein
MPVFFDTGGGDIYGGSSREEVIAAMKEDWFGDDFDESKVFEVSGTMKMRASDENDRPTEELVSIEDEFTEGIGAYCIASENC